MRFLVSGWVHRLLPATTFPAGTLVVNVVGSAALGLLAGLADLRSAISPDQRLWLMIGVLGGFTTFSSFSYETLALAQARAFGPALLSVAANVVLSFVGAWLGFALARAL
jgi:CrcB protein